MISPCDFVCVCVCAVADLEGVSAVISRVYYGLLIICNNAYILRLSMLNLSINNFVMHHLE